ncbi:MAG: PAS domain-containing protein [Proteobacteria bacterium]|nr:PAS domain-containing protein [Pseudomonadota bacterium]
MVEHAVLGTSIVLQFVAAFLALYLIRFTGWRVAWSMIAGAMVLMGVRRSITFYHSIIEGTSAPPNLSAELVALTISVLMVVGAAKIAPIFESIRRNEAALRESEARYARAVSGTNDGLWDWNVRTNENYLSPRWEEIVGHAPGALEPAAQTVFDMVHPDDRDVVSEAVRAHLEERAPYDIEFRLRHKSGDYVWIRSRGQAVWGEDGEPLRMAGSITDITEHRRAEESTQQLRSQLAHASRLSTVGNMAAGLAHEINQPLSAIGSYVQACIRLLRSGKASIEEVVANMEKAAQQVKRAADIVKWLRAFVEKEEAEKTELDLNAAIREVMDFLNAEIRARESTVVLRLTDSLPPVRADKVQIQQVILNLLQNSLEAAPQGPGERHRITIRTLNSTEAAVGVEVEDNGPGIPAEIQGNFFSPFVTTKSEGLGVGLSISKSIIEAHGGRIWAVSDSERGATFAFTLPIAGEASP